MGIGELISLSGGGLVENFVLFVRDIAIKIKMKVINEFVGEVRSSFILDGNLFL